MSYRNQHARVGIAMWLCLTVLLGVTLLVHIAQAVV